MATSTAPSSSRWRPGAGITIGGDIVSIREPAVVPVPDMIDRRTEGDRTPLALGVLGLGVVAALGGFLLRVVSVATRWVAGAADAAYAGVDGVHAARVPTAS